MCQVLGGYGYCDEYQVERLWRDAKLLEIGGGTLEAHHKNMVSCRLEAAMSVLSYGKPYRRAHACFLHADRWFAPFSHYRRTCVPYCTYMVEQKSTIIYSGKFSESTETAPFLVRSNVIFSSQLKFYCQHQKFCIKTSSICSKATFLGRCHQVPCGMKTTFLAPPPPARTLGKLHKVVPCSYVDP